MKMNSTYNQEEQLLNSYNYDMAQLHQDKNKHENRISNRKRDQVKRELRKNKKNRNKWN